MTGIQLVGARYIITTVNTYSDLPSSATVTGKYFYCLNNQGTSWLPGSLGGTYYPKGLYYSTGSTWVYTDTPFEANQIEVDAGVDTDKFVSPNTFSNAAKWDTKLNISALPSNVVFYPTTVASDIISYNRAVTEIIDPDYDAVAVDFSTGAITTTNQLLGGFVVDANVFTGDPGVIQVVTVGNIKRVSGSGKADFYYTISHRDSGGTETLIATSSNTPTIDSAVYQEFNAPALFNNGSFSSTDRLVIKFYANRIAGGSDPTYNFQFGGQQPVRTLFPVPFSVLNPTSGNFLPYAIESTGNTISFVVPEIYNRVTPITGNILGDLTGASLGVVQKIYHNHSVVPTFPAGWVKLGTGSYTTSSLNIIYAEFCGGSRVEYWIVKGS